MAEWEARMAERAAERAVKAQWDEQGRKEDAAHHQKARVKSVQTFIDGPDEELGCASCCVFHPHIWADIWLWGHGLNNGAYCDSDGWLHCSHACHGADGYHEPPMVIG